MGLIETIKKAAALNKTAIEDGLSRNQCVHVIAEAFRPDGYGEVDLEKSLRSVQGTQGIDAIEILRAVGLDQGERHVLTGPEGVQTYIDWYDACVATSPEVSKVILGLVAEMVVDGEGHMTSIVNTDHLPENVADALRTADARLIVDSFIPKAQVVLTDKDIITYINAEPSADVYMSLLVRDGGQETE